MSAVVQIAKKFWPTSIRGQLILGITVVNLVLMTAFVFDMVNRQRRFLKKRNQEQTFSFANNYAMNSSRFIISGDFDELGQMTLSYLNYPNLKYIMILSQEGVILAHSDVRNIGKRPVDSISLQLKGATAPKILIENDYVLDVAVPVTIDKKIIGWARVGVGQQYIRDNLAGLVRNGLIYAITVILVTTLLTIVIANKLSAGLYKLISATNKIKGGDRSVRASPSETIELLELGTAFNQMLDEISANENLLSMVIENMPVGVWILNEKGNIVSTNSAGNQIWSGSPHVGISEFELYKIWNIETKEAIKPENYPAARALKNGETTINEELEIESFNGIHKFILNSALPLKDKKGKIIGAIAINVDITERKKITEQLKLSESTFRSAFNYSAIGMAIVSPDGKFLRVNRELCRMLGYSEDEFLSLTSQNITYPYNVEENRIYREQTLNGTINNFRIDKKYIHKNGTLVWANLSASLVRDSQNKPLFFIVQIEDISESKKVTEQLALSESTFRSAFDYSAIGITLVSPDGKFLKVNKVLCMIVGYLEKELLSLTFQDITHPEDLDQDLGYLRQTVEGKIDSYKMEKRYFHKNGTIIWVHLSVSLVRDSQNKPLFFISQIEDISERKNGEVVLKESEEKFRKLVEETLVGVFILQEGRFVYINPQFEKISGYAKKDLINKIPFEQLIHKDDLEKIKNSYASGIVDEKRSHHYALRGIRKNGSILLIEIIISPISYEGKPADIGTIIDITEKAEEEKRINKAVTDAQENERQQISMELHDNVKQMMAATLLNIDFMKMLVKDDKNAAPVINNIRNYTREAIEELRRISHQLAPLTDASISIEEKIKTVVDTMNVSKEIAISYHFDEFGEEIKVDVQLAMYRIVQEQFTNILKHSNASLVDITVQRRNGDICMSIEDNGVGFDTHKTRNGIGLENIKRRVQVLNGNFSIQTMPGDGCTLYVELPVN
jgi:PAS domain S-box-containing protein